MSKKNNHDSLEARLVALTRDLMLIPSIPSRPEDRQKAFEVIKNHLESLRHLEVVEYEDNGIPSLVAMPKGITKPKILMCGHIDVIEHEDVSSYRSHIENGRIYGPGAGDMKGAIAILLEIFRYIHIQSPKASLGIAITSDEETGGESGIGFLVNKKGLRAHKAMIPDGGSLNHVTIEEKGILHLKVSCKGKSAHSARPWFGVNPIEEMMDKLVYLKTSFKVMQENREKDDKWYPTCAVTMLGTENKQINRIPCDASAILDVRFPAPYTVKKMRKHIKEILGENMRMDIIISAEPTRLSPDNEYKKVIQEVTGQPTVLVRDDGASDARFFSMKDIPVMISRPLVGNLHTTDEWINIESMVTFYKIYEKYLTKVLLK
ncbi:MAG: M20/M25/M40 family metallo-hydrolase [Candidatus Omnitrophica bacterium]|nr:M20/M25/M40 family metallo-hydrolase [Candidatus Omnitrophota bacterium]